VRDERIDVLRGLGLAMIVLAHVDPPGAIFQLRNFDVPLMVLVAGLSYRATARVERYRTYLWSRFERLVLPVWVFLSGYFAFAAITGVPIDLPAPERIWSSYLLLDGIGYVWIIRVFLLVALVAPAIHALHRSESSHLRYFALLSGCYLAYAAAVSVSGANATPEWSWVLEHTVYALVPYALVFAVGLRLPDLDRRQLALLAGLMLAAFLALMWFYRAQAGRFVPTQEFKYPPQSYYLAYALFVAVGAWRYVAAAIVLLRQTRMLPPILFLGRHSIWIYLWHIPLVAAISLPFYVRYPLVLAIASLFAWLQARLLETWLLRISDPLWHRHLRRIFTG